ncbi:hypothetical protein BV898_08490 [Hypsibius exemplaris]|uniref:Uncharacterized protein n=1 Tax=Hypsibius exemplaris TaxID=2072580 RepID=A0A1W0WQA8_HYPEX|nr:hypothetical protein BV898_08490 [Hypsibius exemplaris]
MNVGNKYLCVIIKYGQWTTGSRLCPQHGLICLNRWLAIIFPIWYRLKKFSFDVKATLLAVISAPDVDLAPSLVYYRLSSGHSYPNHGVWLHTGAAAVPECCAISHDLRNLCHTLHQLPRFALAHFITTPSYRRCSSR